MADDELNALARAVREADEDADDVEITDIEGITIRRSGGMKFVAGHLMPHWVEVVFHPALEPETRYRVELIDDVPRVTEVSFRAPPGHREVRQKDVREVVISDLVDELYNMWVIEVNESVPGQVELLAAVDDEGIVPEVRRFIDERRSPGKRRVDTKFLTEVAYVYRENIGHAPTEAVSRTFGVKHRMASNYVSKARDRGLLPPTKQGRAQA